jgi:hypothetical protein
VLACVLLNLYSEAFFVKGPTQNAPVLMGVLNDLLGKNKFLTGAV